MTTHQQKWIWFSAVAGLVIFLDQVSKYLVRTTPELQNKTLIEGWLQLFYTKNPGMAMGISWADTWVISLVAIAASILILVYIFKTAKEANLAYMILMGMIIGGAFGNIADRLFMARVMGYGGVLDGHVVDFIHFSLTIQGWAVFPYIFNVADMAISIAIITMLVFHKKILPDPDETNLEKPKPEIGSTPA